MRGGWGTWFKHHHLDQSSSHQSKRGRVGACFRRPVDVLGWCFTALVHCPALPKTLGKLPDERKRQTPKWRIVTQGLHPHPGPQLRQINWGFDDPEWNQVEDRDGDDDDGTDEIGFGTGPDAAWHEVNEREEERTVSVEQEEGESGDARHEEWEQMLTEINNDKLREQLRQIGCPVVGSAAEPLFVQKKKEEGWIDGSFRYPLYRWSGH